MAKKTNRPKGEIEIEETPLKSSKKKKERPKIFSSLNGEKAKKIIGLSLIFTSLIMLVAFTSYLVTGNFDQNILKTGMEELSTEEIKNWLGKFGAVISQKFIGDWFGIASFIFVPIVLRLGLIVLLKTTIVSTKNVFKYSVFTLLWLPPFLSFFFTNDATLMLGGGVGLVLVSYLNLSIGSIGSLLVILFVLAAFILINYDISLDMVFGSVSKPLGETQEEQELKLSQEEDDLLHDFKVHTSTVEPQEPTPEEQAFVVPDLVSTESEIERETYQETKPIQESTPPILEELPLEVEVPLIRETTPEPIAQKQVTENIPLTTIAPVTSSETVSVDVEIEAIVGDKEETLNDSEIRDLAKEFGDYDPELDLSKYKKPGLDLLKDFGESSIEVNHDELEENKNRIIVTLKNYKIEISKISAVIGPTVTLYEIVPAPGVRISKIKNLEDDIALSLSALGIRIIAPIPGRGTIGIEVPNKKSEIVSMKTMLASDKFQNSDMILPIALGKTISNESYIADLAKMPHLLMAGATGQGKSVGLNAILVSLLYKMHPSQLKFVLVDPKKVELTLYNKIERHYLAKLPDTDEAIITDTQKVVTTLNSLCMEMDQRYDLLKDAMTRTIVEYNAKFVKRKLNPESGHRFLPYIVLVIDEFADLIMTAGKEVETPIARLAQLARAIGIHLIVATQRPSVNVITGMIKANFPARLAFRVTSKIDSRTILDSGGADQLIGRGDLLFSPGNEIIRLQCAFVDTPEVERICDFIGEQQGYSDAFLLPEFVGEAGSSQGKMSDEDRDALFDDAASIIVQHQQGSASLLQRRLKLGYNRAGRIIDQLEDAGVIGPFSGSKARDVLIPDEASLAQILKGGE
ncbi:MAG: S-DNA-T family DNA segregation ATPase FtsK/SpoIIIE [Salibacteraceae bacterium]|jgi:S-DNA-T family DNA segregation ATPase FtsK/SpoIIIE